MAQGSGFVSTGKCAVAFGNSVSKHKSRNSYTTNVENGNITVKDGRIKLPKISPIKMKKHREVPNEYKLKSVTVSREPSGKYYASLLYEYAVCENQAECKDGRIMQWKEWQFYD